MKMTEYKNEVGSLKLSDEFKAELKKKMLEVYEERFPEKKEEKITVSSFSKKYGKYAAIAACLLLVVSTAGILTVKNLPSKSADDSAETVQNSAYDQSAPAQGEDSGDEEGALPQATEPLTESPAEADEAVAEEAEEYDNEILYDPMPSPENTAPEDDIDEDGDVEESAPEAPEAPAADSPYSRYASEDYDGDYNGDDYVLAKRSVTSGGSASVYGTSEAMLANSSPVFVAPAGGGTTDSASEGAELTAEGTELIAEDAEPTDDYIEAPAEYADTPTGQTEDVEEAADSEELETYTGAEWSAIDTSIASYEYYDIRDGVIAKLDKIALIRFTVEDAYTGYVEVSFNTTSGLNMDVATQTLYSININHEYLSNEDEDADRLLLNYGTAEYQLKGRPVMEGEYIALVYENADGVLEPVPQLVYSVHNVNGLDIAYHVYCEDGYEVDPGSTNMGILPQETEMVTNTLNNPELYTQKAAVRELTYYLRRNIMRMEPVLINISGEKPEEEPEDTAPAVTEPAQTEPAQTEPPAATEPDPHAYSNLRANFPTGLLTVTNDDPDADGIITVNGISVGSSLTDAVKAFYLTKYSFTPDAVITLIASEEDGRWSVKVTFEDGIVSKIEMQR